jgi:cell division protein ZapA (FtsZ GTPase activity inhibitor)
MDEAVTITVTIAGRSYPVKVHTHMRDTVLSAVDMLNKRSDEYSKTFIGKETQDYLAMAALMQLVETLYYKQQGDTKLAELQKADETFRAHLDSHLNDLLG